MSASSFLMEMAATKLERRIRKSFFLTRLHHSQDMPIVLLRMNLSIGYISQGRLFLKADLNGREDEIHSEFAANLKKRLQSVEDRVLDDLYKETASNKWCSSETRA